MVYRRATNTWYPVDARGYSYVELTTDASVSAVGTPSGVSGTSGTIVCSGTKPVKVSIAATVTDNTATYLEGFLRWDGVDQTERWFYADGAGNEHICSFAFVPTPTAGSHTFQLSADVDAGSATIYASTENACRLLAEEIG